MRSCGGLMEGLLVGGGLVDGHQGLMDVPQGILWMVPGVSHGRFLWVSHWWAPGSHRWCLGHLMELSWGLMDAPSICCGHSWGLTDVPLEKSWMVLRA